jgi:glycosyltransferase involved in cell wall biosynthesis
MKKILFVSRDDGGCAFYRCHQPASFLKRAGLFDTEVVFKAPSPEQLMSADLVIMQEMGLASSAALCRFMIEHRIPFVSEFDDFVQHVSPRNVSGYGGWNPSTLMVHRSMEQARAGFAVQVSTRQLAREYFPYNPTIHVIPNWLDKDLWDVPVSKKADGKVRIGWAGGNAHADDLHMISKVIQKIIRDHDGKVVFETFGMAPSELSGVFPMPATPTTSCDKCGHEGSHHQHMGEPIREYPGALAVKGWDIALAPVIDNAFGAAKSDLKLKEYAALGIPTVASRVRPYIDAVKDGCPALLAETFEEWYDAIDGLIRQENARRQISSEAKKWAQNNWIQDRVFGIRDIYNDLIAAAERSLGKREDRPGNSTRL